MLSNKQKKQLLKHHKTIVTNSETEYITKMQLYANQFSDYPEVKFLINNVIESDHLIHSGLLPQDLPVLELPEDIQDKIFTKINATFAADDHAGDKLWNDLSSALPKLDQMLRSYRDYLEDQYGMWAYISAPFVKGLSEYIGSSPVLEIMAGNGYISKGLKDLGTKVFPTDSLAWTDENQTGKHQIIPVEKLDAISAIKKYQSKVKYVIMSWSPDKSPIDDEILTKIRMAPNEALELIVIGEKNGATNSKEFWAHANYIKPDRAQLLNEHHQPFDLIHDQVYLIK